MQRSSAIHPSDVTPKVVCNSQDDRTKLDAPIGGLGANQVATSSLRGRDERLGSASTPYQMIAAKLRDELSKSLGKRRTTLWFRDAAVTNVLDDTVTLAVPTDAHRMWLACIYADPLRRACDAVLGPGVKLDIHVSKALDERRHVRDALPERENVWAALLADARPRPQLSSFVAGSSSRFARLLFERILNASPSVSAPASSNPPRSRASTHPSKAPQHEISEAPQHWAALAGPSTILLYGPAGVGKSHLLQAFHAEVHRRRPGDSIYLHARTFTRHFVSAVRGGDAYAVRALESDLSSRRFVLIDDVDQLRGRHATQSHLLTLFRRFARTNTMLIASSQLRPDGRSGPLRVEGFSAQLASRLAGGVAIHLPAPDDELRREILTRRLMHFRVRCRPDVLTALVARSRCMHTCTQLLDRYAIASLRTGSALSPEWLDEVAPPPATSARDEVVRRAKDLVAAHYGISRELLDRSTKLRSAVLPRRVAMYIVYRACALPLKELGRAFGLRSHSSVSRSLSEIRELHRTDPEIEQLIDGLLARL